MGREEGGCLELGGCMVALSTVALSAQKTSPPFKQQTNKS
jgi:hypothetical protein